MNELLKRQDEDGVAILTMQDTSSINSLSRQMLEAMHAGLDALAEDRSIRAAILRTAGDQFSAGHNLKEMTARRSDGDGGRKFFQDLFGLSSAMMLKILRLPQPVIAEVKGIATAAGCQLVSACDLAVASEDARFATSGVKIGLFCSTPMVALSRNVPRKRAMEMLLLGEFLTAAEAQDIGLVNRVVPRDRLEHETMDMARKIADKSPVAISMGKRAFYQQVEMPVEEAYSYAGKVMAENMMAKDAKAGFAAFIGKQPMPEWSGE